MNKKEFELRECIAITNQGIRYDDAKDHARYVRQGGKVGWQVKLHDGRWVRMAAAKVPLFLNATLGLSSREVRLTMLALRDNPVEL